MWEELTCLTSSIPICKPINTSHITNKQPQAMFSQTLIKKVNKASGVCEIQETMYHISVYWDSVSMFTPQSNESKEGGGGEAS